MLRFYAFHHRLFGFFSASLLTVVVLDSGDLLARNEPMHWEFDINAPTKRTLRNTVKTADRREETERGEGKKGSVTRHRIDLQLNPCSLSPRRRGQGFNR